jgi:2-keto-4-pentenoate hydratase/2-oxohepta-3-ene-1,7-dioic acid hydratase in catechol pathway
MVIGRCITRTGDLEWFCSEDTGTYYKWDPFAMKAGDALSVDRIVAPVPASKIVAVGFNYRDHAAELGRGLPEEPVLFMKPSTSIIGPGDAIVYPPQASRLDYEAELAIVIGKRCRNVGRDDAREYILGYTCLNDVTARDLQAKDGQWTRAKSFDTFAPMGPWVALGVADPHSLSISARLNGEVVQLSNTKNLVFDCCDLVAFVSSVMTLLPFDVIATGTPSGIGPMNKGDEISVTIEGIGTLTNHVE